MSLPNPAGLLTLSELRPELNPFETIWSLSKLAIGRIDLVKSIDITYICVSLPTLQERFAW